MDLIDSYTIHLPLKRLGVAMEAGRIPWCDKHDIPPPIYLDEFSYMNSEPHTSWLVSDASGIVQPDGITVGSSAIRLVAIRDARSGCCAGANCSHATWGPPALVRRTWCNVFFLEPGPITACRVADPCCERIWGRRLKCMAQ